MPRMPRNLLTHPMVAWVLSQLAETIVALATRLAPERPGYRWLLDALTTEPADVRARLVARSLRVPVAEAIARMRAADLDFGE